jgi:hypothetical protein
MYKIECAEAEIQRRLAERTLVLHLTCADESEMKLHWREAELFIQAKHGEYREDAVLEHWPFTHESEPDHKEKFDAFCRICTHYTDVNFVYKIVAKCYKFHAYLAFLLLESPISNHEKWEHACIYDLFSLQTFHKLYLIQPPSKTKFGHLFFYYYTWSVDLVTKDQLMPLLEFLWQVDGDSLPEHNESSLKHWMATNNYLFGSQARNLVQIYLHCEFFNPNLEDTLTRLRLSAKTLPYTEFNDLPKSQQAEQLFVEEAIMFKQWHTNPDIITCLQSRFVQNSTLRELVTSAQSC